VQKKVVTPGGWLLEIFERFNGRSTVFQRKFPAETPHGSFPLKVFDLHPTGLEPVTFGSVNSTIWNGQNRRKSRRCKALRKDGQPSSEAKNGENRGRIVGTESGTGAVYSAIKSLSVVKATFDHPYLQQAPV